MRIRHGTVKDADVIAVLLADYLRESYGGQGGSTPEQLRRDVLGDKSRHHILLAESGEQLVGFVAWDIVYDLQWAASGAQVADLFVVPSRRGLGVALALITHLAAEVRDGGGSFLRGAAREMESVRTIYGRVAVVTPSGETHLSNRAFRRIAELAECPIRDTIRTLPPVEWNYEA
jgi:GNAT superfamily N-acetyltransferase